MEVLHLIHFYSYFLPISIHFYIECQNDHSSSNFIHFICVYVGTLFILHITSNRLTICVRYWQIGVTSKMNIDIAISLLIIINVLKLVAGMEKCNVCYCETGKFGMSDIRWLYILRFPTINL